MRESVSIGTESMPLMFAKAEAGCNTQRVHTSEKMIDTCVTTNERSSQAVSRVRDAGCGGAGIITEMQNQASQMNVEVKDSDVTCDLLLPSDEDECEGLEEVTCIKCNGTQMNKKGLPCRKCNGRGTLVSRELSALAAIIRQEVQDFCYTSFKKLFADRLEEKREAQENVVHSGIVCDGCEANPVKGIRFMCSVCSDCDFCQRCVRSGVHSQHPLLKVRKPSQAPHKLICQYRSAQVPAPATSSVRANGTNIAAAAADDCVWERQQPSKQARYSARFVRESPPDKQEFICGDFFCKSWWIRNDGEIAWPTGT